MQLDLKFEFTDKERNIIDDTTICREINSQLNNIPEPGKEIMNGIKWGEYCQLFTPAYWKAQYLMYNYNENFNINYRLGDNLIEEITACLLGGFGFKAELGLLAFHRLKERKLIRKGVTYIEISSNLTEPFLFNQKEVHYRFPNQKSKFIHEFLNRNDIDSIPKYNDITLRNWLLTVKGIGAKTASWITRNYLNSENVAIIDIHIYRACYLMGLFSQHFDIQKDYDILEHIFLNFCQKLDVQPSKMDAIMWLQMKQAHRTTFKI